MAWNRLRCLSGRPTNNLNVTRHMHSRVSLRHQDWDNHELLGVVSIENNMRWRSCLHGSWSTSFHPDVLQEDEQLRMALSTARCQWLVNSPTDADAPRMLSRWIQLCLGLIWVCSTHSTMRGHQYMLVSSVVIFPFQPASNLSVLGSHQRNYWEWRPYRAMISFISPV